jgi:hypothetical protein
VATSKDPLVEASLDLAWSHWVGLGVRGVARAPDTAVDLEALLCFTAYVMQHDLRLAGEVADWWQQFHHHISEPRLKVVARIFGEEHWRALRTVLASSKTPSGKSRLDRLDTPARSMLRLRSVFGANARAEILLEMLTHSPEADLGWTALALSEVGYSKRNVALILEDLVLGGILVTAAEGNRLHYRVANRRALAEALHPLPASSGRWHQRLPIVAQFLELASRLRDRDAVVQGVEAQKLFSRLRPAFIAAGLRPAVPDADASTYWRTLQSWLVDNLLSERGDSRRHVLGMIEGFWISPTDKGHRLPAYPNGAVLPRLATGRSESHQLRCLDLVQAPVVGSAGDWAWAVLSTAATGTYSHASGLERGDRWRFVAKDSTEYDVSFDEELSADRIRRLYGSEAATRARTDRPAVQLRLVPATRRNTRARTR